MKTPDEIKKGLECCEQIGANCDGCPYYGECMLPFGDSPESDALAYIHRLERERDAAVKRLARYKKCIDCARYTDVVAVNMACDGCEFGSKWQWRGAQEVE